MFVDFDAEWPPPPPWTPTPKASRDRITRKQEGWLVFAVLIFLAAFTIAPLAGVSLISLALASLSH